MTAPRKSLSWTLAAALLAAGCVERATNVQSHNRPSPVADTGVAPPGLSPSTLRRLGYDGDGSMGQPLRFPVRACDEPCLRNRGTPLLHLLRLAHRGPDRMRRILVAIDMPYARLWMAWLALATSDEEEARATLAEARSELRSPEHQARYRRALTAMGAGASPTLEQEIVAEMRAQLDGWSALDDELGREMAAVLPCAQFAPRGASTALAFRPLGDARSDDDALRFVERCANREIDALAMDGGTSAARDAIRALGDGVLSLVTAADAAVDPALDARVRTRIVEPFFVPSFQDPPVPDRAVLDGAAARDPATRAAVTAWLRARTAHLDTFARALCAKLTAAEPRTTVAQCRVRATSAINASALAVLGPAPRETTPLLNVVETGRAAVCLKSSRTATNRSMNVRRSNECRFRAATSDQRT